MSRCTAVAIDTGDDSQDLDAEGKPIARRVSCTIADGLLRMGDPEWSLEPSVRAALLWRAFNRYSELVGLKKLTGGLSGSDVLVFRPKLKPPAPDDDPDVATAGPADVLAGAWGSPLLVKTGKESELRKEWVRFNRFLRDRQSPFIAHLEELLVVHPTDATAAEPLAVLVGSFLGGDVVRAEPLDKVIRGTRDADRCLRLIDQVFAHLATWHTNPQPRPLADWPRVFRFADRPSPAAPWLLFGRYNFRKETQASPPPAWDIPRKGGEASLGRLDFTADLRWDVPFGQRDHLSVHLLGKGEKLDGLLAELLNLPVQFSLIHGDLNPRNVLCDAGNTWLIDFEHTGVGPILADFARLEINLRFWCIELAGGTANAGQVAEELERLLLAHFHGSESSLEPVRGFARRLGADADELVKVARCVVHLRKLARRWCVSEHVDGRDYLGVLYLTLLGLLPAAAKKVAAANVRWGVGLFWVLEEALDRVFGREPFVRGQTAYHPRRQVSAEWLRAGDAGGRVQYLCGTADGEQALAPVVALRGVLQGGYHHLDAYYHTLAVLTYLEAILADSVGALTRPAELDEIVSAKLVSFGLPAVPMMPDQVASEVKPDWWTDELTASVARFLGPLLTDDARLLLKWCGLLHDVGKPGTRTVRVKGTTEEVQFLGHEHFGLSVAREELEAWFPHDPTRERLAGLMRNHHTSHQLFGNTLLAADRGALARLRQSVGGTVHSDSLALLAEASEKSGPDLPLLLLHGYADRLAARGVKVGQRVDEWAEATLLVLAGLAEYPRLVAAHEAARGQGDRLTAAARAFAAEHGLPNAALGELKRRLSGQVGTTDELRAWLNATVPAADRARLGGKR